MTYGTVPGHLSRAFPDLDSQRLKHRGLVRLNSTPLLDWRSTLNAALTRFRGAGRVEWKP